MKIEFSKGFYYEKDYYWQCIFIPSIALLSGLDNEESRYYCLTIEWLFWNTSITFNHD